MMTSGSALDFIDIVPADSFLGRLRAEAEEAWEAYVGHDFVRQLAVGALPKACFQYYLAQDYQFLRQYARAYALAAYKAPDLDSMSHFSAVAQVILGTEMGLHVTFCRGWGISETEMLRTPEGMATIAYTRYVLDQGQQGDVLDLQVALVPCMVGYAEIANRIKADSDTVLEGNPYREWIEMYASDAFQDLARAEIALLDRLAHERGGSLRRAALLEVFRRACHLEAAFWEQGLVMGR